MDPLNMPPKTRPEVELLCYCARTRIEPDVARRVRSLLAGGIDWKYLLQSAGHHGVLPLLHRTLSSSYAGVVPEPILQTLRTHFHANSLRNLFLTSELLKVLDLLGGNRVRALPFKGPALTVTAYGDLALREFSDLDILVPRRDARRARDLLRAHGYREDRHLDKGDDTDDYAYKLVRGDAMVVVEVHWKLGPWHLAMPLSAESLWRRVVPLRLIGKTVPNLTPEDALLVLCAHGRRHAWNQLDLICSVAELVRQHPGLDWDHVLRQAEALRSERVVLVGLGLAEDLLGVALPPRVLRRAQRDAVSQALTFRARERLFARPEGVFELVDYYTFQLLMKECFWDKARYFSHLVRKSAAPDTPSGTAGPAGTPRLLHRLLRPLRAARKHGWAPVRYIVKRVLRSTGWPTGSGSRSVPEVPAEGHLDTVPHGAAGPSAPKRRLA